MDNEIRVGKVSTVDYQPGMIRVVYHDQDDSVTRPIPTLSTEYKMPKIGDQVLVIHLSNGTEAGVILGRPWSDKNRPPESGPGLYRKELGQAIGEAVIRYNLEKFPPIKMKETAHFISPWPFAAAHPLPQK